MGLTVNVSKEKLLSSEMIQDYIESVKETVKASFPEIDDDELQKVIEEELTNTVNTIPVISFENNYTKTKKKTDLLSWYSWFKKKKPITTEHGVVYKRHDESVNLSAKLLEFILDTRKYHKKKMLECKNNGDKIGEAFHNIRQKVYKIFANSYYGAMGEMRAIFYNLFTALSITGKGQSLITNAAMSFEMFFADNLQFKSMDDVYIYIRNIKNEKRNFKDSVCLKKQISSEKLKKRLKDLFGKDYKNRIDDEILDSIIDKLSKKDINRIYYKNNLYEFCKNETILEKIYLIMDKVESFRNPNEVPKEIEEDLKELWSWLKEFVYYDHTIFDHTNIVKEMKRKTVVVVNCLLRLKYNFLIAKMQLNKKLIDYRKVITK